MTAAASWRERHGRPFRAADGSVSHFQGAPPPWLLLELIQPVGSRRRRIGRRPQFADQLQDLGEQAPWNRDLGHLEGNIAAVAYELGADLDQLLLQAGQRPVLDRLGRRQRAQDVAEVVGQRVKLEPDGVGGERPARQPRPVDRILALFDPLLRRAALIVEGDNPLGAA